MGEVCSGRTDTDQKEIFIEENAKIDVKVLEGYPAEEYAININQLNTRVKDIEEKQSIKKLIFEMSEVKKLFKDPYQLKKKPIERNHLEQTYYLPTLNAFYVGEWASYQNFDRKNLPYGIGRLYEKNTVSEGVFQTYSTEQKQISDQNMKLLSKIKEEDSDEQNQAQNNRKSQKNDQTNNFQLLFNIVKKQEENQEQFTHTSQKRRKSMNVKDFVVRLNGEGRINMRQIIAKRKKQYIMEGNFNVGVLSGRGKLKIYDNNELVYFYDGDWKFGCKNGKCIETGKQNFFEQNGEESIKQFRYQGRYSDNKRKGKGILSFMSSKKEQHALQEDLTRFQKMMKQDGSEMRLNILKKIQMRKIQEAMIDEKLNAHKFPENQLSIKFQNKLLGDIPFNLLREYRKVFQEKYDGQFENNYYHGEGFYLWKTTKAYRGTWQEGVMNGQGQFFWPSGEFYQGQYKNDERFGKGIMVWSLFRRYRGSWAYSMRHGYGQSIQINVQDYEQKKAKIRMTVKGGIWIKDKLSEQKFCKNFLLDTQRFIDFEAALENVKELQNN